MKENKGNLLPSFHSQTLKSYYADVLLADILCPMRGAVLVKAFLMEYWVKSHLSSGD